jgi:hypothetical protein
MIDKDFNKNDMDQYGDDLLENEIDHYYCYLKQEEIFEDRRNPYTEEERNKKKR